MDWTNLVDVIEKIHDGEPNRAAELLEANLGLVNNAEEAERFTALTNHIFGENQNEWARAASLNRRAVERIATSPSARGAVENLSVSHFMAGDLADGLATELEAVRCAGHDGLACAIAIRLRVALFLLERGERITSIALFAAAARLARSLDRQTVCDRTVAKMANNMAAALLEITDRTHPEDEALEQGALAARDFWLKCGTWENHERADYLLALVYNALRRHDLAHEVARRGLATIDENGREDADRAFLMVEVAHAARHLGSTDEAAETARVARELGAKLSEPSQKKRFARESAKLD
jgi:hypothetical protein